MFLYLPQMVFVHFIAGQVGNSEVVTAISLKNSCSVLVELQGGVTDPQQCCQWLHICMLRFETKDLHTIWLQGLCHFKTVIQKEHLIQRIFLRPHSSSVQVFLFFNNTLCC